MKIYFAFSQDIFKKDAQKQPTTLSELTIHQGIWDELRNITSNVDIKSSLSDQNDFLSYVRFQPSVKIIGFDGIADFLFSLKGSCYLLAN